jgi:hypothetical protein
MYKRVAAALVATGIALLLVAPSASAAPSSTDAVVGSKPWAVVLCQFSDTVGQQPHTVQWYTDFVTHSAPGHDGLWDYWHDISYGKLDLNGSQVITQTNGGWNTLPHTVAYYRSLPRNARLTLWRDCADSASSTDYSRFYGVLAMLNVKIDSGAVFTGPLSTSLNGKSGAWGAVVLDPAGGQDVSWAAHETGHAFGLNHNYDTALNHCTNPPSPNPGEYCDAYDQMGYENSWNTFQTSSFGNSAPGMTGPNLIKLGFVDPTVINPFNGSQDVPLASLETTPEVIQVPVGDDPRHYYTIEYRDSAAPYASGTAWGQKLPGPGIVIHEARPNGLFYLVDTGGGPNFQLCQTFNGANTITIGVLSMPSPWAGTEAFVRIGNTNDGVTDLGSCDVGSATVTNPSDGGGGGGGLPGANCMGGVCGPKLPICGLTSGGGACIPNPTRMQ